MESQPRFWKVGPDTYVRVQWITDDGLLTRKQVALLRKYVKVLEAEMAIYPEAGDADAT